MNQNPSITPNPGGQLAPNLILGRDKLINRLWVTLEGRSIYMNDLRRIGKTQIMVKMQAEPAAGWHPVKRDLGGLHSAAEFATRVYLDAAEILSVKKRVLRGMSTFLSKAGGTEIGGVLKLPDGQIAPWKDILFRTFADIEQEMAALETETGQPARMVFFWDEVPFLLDNIVKREGPSVAMEVLDTLRAFGQDHNHIRLVLTGSIGIHHVLATLRKEGHNHSPLNRMEHVSPGPLDPPDACELAARLLAGAGLTSKQPDICAQTIATSVGNVAFYIHKLVSRLPLDQSLTPEIIDHCLLREITSDQSDDWDFAHYRNRLRDYYREEESLSLAVLDAVAVNQPIDFNAIRKEVAALIPNFSNDEQLRDLLKLLCRDHYLVRTEENTYRFYLDLIRRWWRTDRAL